MLITREAEANDLEDDENSSANQNMTALNTQSHLKNNSEQDSVANVNYSMQINWGDTKISTSMNPMLKSVASAQNVTPRSTHDFTEIMGYKNIDMSRDVD